VGPRRPASRGLSACATPAKMGDLRPAPASRASVHGSALVKAWVRPLCGDRVFGATGVRDEHLSAPAFATPTGHAATGREPPPEVAARGPARRRGLPSWSRPGARGGRLQEGSDERDLTQPPASRGERMAAPRIRSATYGPVGHQLGLPLVIHSECVVMSQDQTAVHVRTVGAAALLVGTCPGGPARSRPRPRVDARPSPTYA